MNHRFGFGGGEGGNVLTFQECAEHTEAGGGVGGVSEIKDFLLCDQRKLWPQLFVSSSAGPEALMLTDRCLLANVAQIFRPDNKRAADLIQKC